MNGPENYAEAGRLAEAYKTAITTAEQMPADTMQQSDERYTAMANARTLLDKAQVHALLAQTAAIASLALPGVDGPESLADRDWAWARVLEPSS